MQKYLYRNKSFFIPTICWILFSCTILTLIASGYGKRTDLINRLIQWDGKHYLSIALNGYEAFPCPDSPQYICGNVGWFPLYPILAGFVGKIFRAIALDFRYGLIVANLLFLWLGLLVMFRLVTNLFDESVALWSIILLLTFPTAFYFLTAFPYALFFLLAVTAIWMLDSGRYLWSAIAIGLLSITYPSGVVIVLAVIWFTVTQFKNLNRVRLWQLSAIPIASGLALLIYCLYNLYTFHDFFLYVTFQSKPYYAHSLSFPLFPIIRTLLGQEPSATVFQPQLISIMLIIVILLSILFYTKSLPKHWLIYMIGMLLFTPTMGSTVSYYRHIIVAFPLFVMIAQSGFVGWRKKIKYGWVVAGPLIGFFFYMSTFKAGALM